jgi:hypothetical protein
MAAIVTVAGPVTRSGIVIPEPFCDIVGRACETRLGIYLVFIGE